MELRKPDPPARKPVSLRPRLGPRRAATAAVLGSIAFGGGAAAAAQRPGHPSPDGQRRQSRRADSLPPGEHALIGRVFGALSAQAPGIARSILATGVGDGTVTQTEVDRFLARLASVKATYPPAGQAPPAGAAAPTVVPPGPAAQALFRRALAAIQAALPVIAMPMVSAAVADGSISEAQAERLRGRLRRGPPLGFGLVVRDAAAVTATRLP